jgi:hypothetical protein
LWSHTQAPHRGSNQEPESADKKIEKQWKPMKSAFPRSRPFTQQVKKLLGKPLSPFWVTRQEPNVDGVCDNSKSGGCVSY